MAIILLKFEWRGFLDRKILHGNNAKVTGNDIEPVYQTNVITPKTSSSKKSTAPVSAVDSQNVFLGKQFVDENHK